MVSSKLNSFITENVLSKTPTHTLSRLKKNPNKNKVLNLIMQIKK